MNFGLPGALLRSNLSIGISRTSIRLAHVKRYEKKKDLESRGYDESWGEEIWVHAHRLTGQCVYSHVKVLDSKKALNQLPFNGKKTKPAKLRKDYWAPMALISFGQGRGFVGRSVMQKLREFRQLHELSWGEEVARDPYSGRTRSKTARGYVLNNQRPYAIADMAAVLAGAGGGNKIWEETEEEVEARKKVRPTTVDWEAIKAKRRLHDATLWWYEDSDKAFAKEWTENVSHRLLRDLPSPEPEAAEDIPEAAEATTGATA